MGMLMSVAYILRQLIRHGQKPLVYPSAFDPHPRSIESPSYYGLNFEDIELKTSDNVTLRCFLIKQPVSRALRGNDDAQPINARATVIMFHGNGMNHGDILEGAKQFFKLKCNVLTVSYRGYGFSEGVPSEKGLRIDSSTALEYVLHDEKLSKIPVVLYGQSLGGAVAIDLASREPSKISALIVENTFTSLPDIVRGWPYIGRFAFICTQKWDSASKISKIPTSVPILMLSGSKDEVVPTRHMHSLWALAHNRGKDAENYTSPEKDTFKSFPKGYHPDTYIQPGYWTTVQDFLQQVLGNILQLCRALKCRKCF
ncbi:Alpha/Beta hydrolase protein [Cyathus striatus]|nr:Alpha/Beta hydrolase protein [Cyathus striatus]